MSVNGGGGMLSDNYGDIESQLFLNTARINGTSGTGGNSDFIDQTISETPTGDLDRNELAELLKVRIIATTSVRDLGEDEQTDPGNVRNDVLAAINEFDSQEQPNIELQDSRGGATDFRPGVKNDAAGTIAEFNQVVHPQIDDETVGNAAGSDGGETTVVEVDYTDMGGGPVLDRFDDILLAVKVSGGGMSVEFGTETRMQCWYRVDEFEDRPTFGRP